MNKITQAQFLEQTPIPVSLAKAVIRQMGGWNCFKKSAPDICRGGIDGGFNGFIYNSDTESFAKRNREQIRAMAQAMAKEQGVSVVEMVQGFGCFRHGAKPTEYEINLPLYQGMDAGNGLPVLKALAWLAGEETAHSYCELAGYND